MPGPIDLPKPTDKLAPTKLFEGNAQAKAKIESLTNRLVAEGVSRENAGSIAQHIAANAEGPIALDDWGKMDADRFSNETKRLLKQEGMTPGAVVADDDLGEAYVAQVLRREGMPDGNGSTEPMQGVVPGHFDQRGWGIDLVGVNAEGTPLPIEVKDTNDPESRTLSSYDVKGLEPEVQSWKAQREAQVRATPKEDPPRPESGIQPEWRPEQAALNRQIEDDRAKMEKNNGELPVQQMDDLWTKDRWLKLIKSPEGRARLRQAGVDEKYLNYQELRQSPDHPTWQAILDQRSTVVISDREGDVGHRLALQAMKEKRSKRVITIEM